MDKNGSSLPPVIIFLGIILIVGFVTMSWLPGLLEETLTISKSISQTIGTVVLLIVLGILYKFGLLQ